MSDLLKNESQGELSELKSAYEAVRRYAENVAPIEPFSDEQIRLFAANEVGQGAILLDAEGLSTGMKEQIFPRVREYLQNFADARRIFGDKFQPFLAEIERGAAIPSTIASIEESRDKEVSETLRELQNTTTYQNYLGIKARFDQQVKIHPTQPNLKAIVPKVLGIPLYVVAMMFVGVAEYFINYDTVYIFFGIPIIALGVTFIFGIFLALISHVHGTDIKQWKRKFGRAVERQNRSYALFTIVTFGLIGLVAVVGWMRYVSVMSAMEAQPTANLLGTTISVAVNPVREVIISLGGNLAAWMVGLLIAYFCHDADPIYMQTAIDFRKQEKLFRKEEQTYRERIGYLKARCELDVSEQKNMAAKFEQDQTLATAQTLREQVAQYDEGIYQRIKTFVMVQVTRYKSQLYKALNERPNLLLYRTDGGQSLPVPATDYQNVLMNFSELAVSKNLQMLSR